MNLIHPLVIALGCALAGVCSCSSSDSDSGETEPDPICADKTEVPCSDEVILQMNLQSDRAPGLMTTAQEGDGWRSQIDATAGGAFASDPDSYVYGRFTDSGLEKVEISDEESLDSMDWDIAFRRYVIRINSGHSGPSCVSATRIPGDPAYDEVTELPSGTTYHKDLYFTDSCELIEDTSGLPNSPATVLSGYWTYSSCVAMTHATYAIQLANGRHLKLTVESYYTPEVQQQCDTTDTIPMTETGAANIEIRWAFL